MAAPCKPIRYEVQMMRELIQMVVVEVEAKDEYEAVQKAQDARIMKQFTVLGADY